MIHVLKFLKGIIFGFVIVISVTIIAISGLVLTAKIPDLANRLLRELTDDLFS